MSYFPCFSIRCELRELPESRNYPQGAGTRPSHLRGEGVTQLDLFGEALRAERVRRIYDGIDRLDAKYGKHTVFLGSSFPAMQGQQHTSDRAELPRRQRMLLQGENDRQRLGIPLLGDVR